jgi:hypothetical protein
MNKSENINELATALAKAQGAMRFAIKDANNPFFKSKYADLSSIVEAIRDSLAGNCLSYMQHLHPSDKHEVCVETIVLHSSGQWISCGVVGIPVNKNDAQGYGSALTYARRYSLAAAVGVVADDDDGNAAASAAPKSAAAYAKPNAPTPSKPAPMPDDIKAKKEQLKAAAKPASTVIEGTATTISGDPNEGNLDDVAAFDKPADEVTKSKVVNAFAQIGFTLPRLEQEYGKPMDQWMESDIPELRLVLKSMKIQQAQIKAAAAEQDGGEL